MRCAQSPRLAISSPIAGLLAQVTALFGVASLCFAQTPQVRISQVFPYGGLLANEPRATYIELYNSADTSISVTGWTVQVANPVNSIWEAVPLAGAIGPKGYYLVQMSPNSSGTPLPAPDAGPFNVTMPQSGGKVALVLDSLVLSGRPACPFPTDLVDIVGWGNADQRVPCGAVVPTFNNAPAPSLTTAVLRKCGGKADVGATSDMFTTGAPNPRNTGSPANTNVDVSITPTPAAIPAYPTDTVTITATAATSSCAGAITGATINLAPIGGPVSVPLASIGGGQYRITLNLGSYGLSPGSYALNLSSTASLISELGSGKVTLLIRPANDDCGNATFVSPGDLPETFTVNNDGAQPDIDPGDCTASTQGDFGVWWAFVPPAAGVLRIDQTGAQDAAIGVFLNGCGPNGSAACVNDNSAAVQVAAGQTYKLLVVRRNATQLTAPPLSVHFDFTIVAPNDSPCTAVPLTAGMPVDSNNTDATSTEDGPATICASGTITPVKSVWYSFTPPVAGLYRVSTCGSPIDTDLSVFTISGCPGTVVFTPVSGACDRASCVGGEPGPGPGTGSPDAALIDNLSLGAGTNYLIRVSSSGAPAGGSFQILASAIITGACCDANTGDCAISTTGACPSGQTYLGAGTTCAPGSCVPAPTGACCNYTTTACAVLTAAACDGGRVFLGVGASCTAGACVLDNDECANAVRVFVATPIVGSTLTASTSVSLDLGSCGTNGGVDGSDVFYVFTPPVTTLYEVSLCGSDYDTVLGIHTGCPATVANRLFCNDDAVFLCGPTYSRASRIPNAVLNAGVQYYIRVAGYNGATGNFHLVINSTGVCCRGATCTTELYTPQACAASGGPLVHPAFVSAATSCNPSASAIFPCCYADFNKSGVIEVQDIFDFLGAWFAGSPFAHVAGDGIAPPVVQDIFDFLGLWFAENCY